MKYILPTYIAYLDYFAWYLPTYMRRTHVNTLGYKYYQVRTYSANLIQPNRSPNSTVGACRIDAVSRADVHLRVGPTEILCSSTFSRRRPNWMLERKGQSSPRCLHLPPNALA